MAKLFRRKKTDNISRYLTEDERGDKSNLSYAIGRAKALRRLKSIRAEARQVTTKAGRRNVAINNFFRAGISQRRRQIVASQGLVPRGRSSNGGVRYTGKRGRPVGSYDPRYAKYGGVYGYRKLLSAKLRQERLEQYRRLAVNPRQQLVLDQIEARDRAVRTNPENQAIPDTTGFSSIGSFEDEINFSANLVK